MNWTEENGLLLIPLILGCLSVWMLMPSEKKRSRLFGYLFGLASFVILKFALLPGTGDFVRSSLFLLFAGTAVLSAGMMITDRNPVYSALWFAMTTLAVCGLFLLNSAPFLSAATIIVYAGAIIVTFLFVIMLAQQTTSSNYDEKPTLPLIASIAGFLLLGTLLFGLQEWGAIDGKNADRGPQPGQFAVLPEGVRPNPLSQAAYDNPKEIGSLRVLGRSLFGDYLFSVELAGTVLLIATIGAIAIAPRRSQGTL